VLYEVGDVGDKVLTGRRPSLAGKLREPDQKGNTAANASRRVPLLREASDVLLDRCAEPTGSDSIDGVWTDEVTL